MAVTMRAHEILAPPLSQLATLDDAAERTVAIKYLVFMFGCPIVHLVAHSLAALTALATEQANRFAVVQAGAVAPLIQLLFQSEDPAVLTNAANTLGVLALDDTTRPLILSKGAARHLAALCGSQFGDAVVEAAVGALRNLSRDETGRATMIQEGAIPRAIPVPVRVQRPALAPHWLRLRRIISELVVHVQVDHTVL